MAPDPDEEVERLVDEALKHCNVQALDEIILDESREGRASKCSKQFLSKLDKLINRELNNGNVKNASVVFTIIHKLGDMLVFPGGKGLSEMVSQGLTRKMVAWFGKVKKLWIEAGPVRNEVMINLAEDFFDALMVVHESCTQGTYQVTESLLHNIGKLASDSQVNILIQKEAARKLNVILGKIPVELKKEKKILSSQEAVTVMDDLASRILKGGDYDLQVALMEALCRMTSHSQRRELADRWFSMEFIASAFSSIQDSEFETDCRKFLNLVNGMQGEERRVYSYPCLEVFLDKHELLMPVDENLKEFWIDFNLGSQSISFYFCLGDDQAQEGQWDTLCIGENEILSYTVEDEKDVKVLQLVLTEPVFVSNIEGSRLTIHFSSSLDILQATKKVYGEAKNKKFIGKTTTSVVKTTVQIILDEGGSQVLFPESQLSSEPTEKTVPRTLKNGTPFQSCPHLEKDAQSHNQQTVTPQRSKTSETCMFVFGSAGRKLGKSPFSCVIPATPHGKAKAKPALQMVTSSSVQKNRNVLKELMLAKLSHSVPLISEHVENLKKQVFPPLQTENVPQDRKSRQEAEKYRRHISVDKAVEMVQADQELDDQPLDSSMVPDSQPSTRKETSILPGLCHFTKNKRSSVSESMLPWQKELLQSEIIASTPVCPELPQRPSSAQCNSGVLTHKQLHAQLTKRLQQVLREREQQGEPCTVVQKGSSSVGQHMTKPRSAEKGPASVKKSMPAKPAQSAQAKGNMGKNKSEKAAGTVVKQISSHYKSTTSIRATPEKASQFNTSSANRDIFNKSWYPGLTAKISSAGSCEFLNSRNQSKKLLNQPEDVFKFQLDAPKCGGKKMRNSSETSGIETSNSLDLSSSAKKCPPAKPVVRNVKKHLFSDTDADNMTEVSWIKSENRRPKPKVADYTRQPAKPRLPPADTTFETPNMPLSSANVEKKLPKPRMKRQKKVVEQKEKRQNAARGRPAGRPQRNAAQTKSYKEPSDSENESETVEPPPAKKQIIKQTEKPQNRDAFQTRRPAAKKENTEAKSKTSHAVVKEKTERQHSPEQLKRKKKMLIDAMESTKGQKESGSSNVTSFSSINLSTNKMRSKEKGVALPGSSLRPLGPLFEKNHPQKAPAEVTGEEEKKDLTLYVGVMEGRGKENIKPGETPTKMSIDKNLIDKEDVATLRDPKQSKSKKTLQELTKDLRESWTTKLASFSPSPVSIENMRSAEKSATLSRSPITPLRLPAVSPVGAVSPPLEPPEHLKGIQASSFYKTSRRQSNARLPCSPSMTPVSKKHSAAEGPELSPAPSMAPPLIASTGRETLAHSSELSSPDLEEDLRGFLNSVSCRSLQASFDKESVVSLVTLSQSSHRSVNNIAMICTNLEKTPERSQEGKADETEFKSGPATRRKQHSSSKSDSLSGDSEEEEDTKVVPSQLAITMKPRKLFKPNEKPWNKKKVDQTSSEDEQEEEKTTGKRRRLRKSSPASQSGSPSAAVEDVEMRSTVVSNIESSCWEASVEADADLPQSEISSSQEMSYVCRQFSTELKRKFENRSRRMDIFTKQSLKTFKHHVSSISVQVHKYRSQRLEKVKGVLMDEIKNLEQEKAALHNMEEELTSFWKKQAMSFHTYHERGTQRLHNLKSAIETNVCHSLEYEEQIFSSEMCLMKKDMKSVQDRIFNQMQEEELLSVRRGLQTLFLPDVSMF
ncbi:synaptonemal complex protein 2 [Astyanax mexicanus]|uniref:synaptonemal complex protein 2 n=1 Tax=Astyanax mexicanus TaxID=7994 RepID=UPI0020CB36F1|nr:synaptonemal complex protein 2 [Astyanax mexicanus]